MIPPRLWTIPNPNLILITTSVPPILESLPLLRQLRRLSTYSRRVPRRTPRLAMTNWSNGIGDREGKSDSLGDKWSELLKLVSVTVV